MKYLAASGSGFWWAKNVRAQIRGQDSGASVAHNQECASLARLVGVVLKRKLAVRLLNLPLSCPAVELEDLIWIEVLVLCGDEGFDQHPGAAERDMLCSGGYTSDAELLM